MTRVTLVCSACGHKARRALAREPGSRGVHETSSEPALCPKGHGLMRRADGVRQERWAPQLQRFLTPTSTTSNSRSANVRRKPLRRSR